MLPDFFSFVWDEKIAGSGHPGAGGRLIRSLGSLRKEGIGAILTLTESPLEAAVLSEHGFESLHLSTPDFSPPTLEQAERAAEFVQDQLDAGRGVLVHCFAGIGRTGTILACLLAARGLSAAQAIDEVRRRRPGSLETQGQEMLVHEFARRFRV